MAQNELVTASTPPAATQPLAVGHTSLMHGWVPLAVQVVTAVVLVLAAGWRSRPARRSGNASCGSRSATPCWSGSPPLGPRPSLPAEPESSSSGLSCGQPARWPRHHLPRIASHRCRDDQLSPVAALSTAPVLRGITTPRPCHHRLRHIATSRVPATRNAPQAAHADPATSCSAPEESR